MESLQNPRMAKIKILRSQWLAATTAPRGSLPVIHREEDGRWIYGGLRRLGQIYERLDGVTKAQISLQGATRNCPLAVHTFVCGELEKEVDCIAVDTPRPMKFVLPFPLSENEERARKDWREAEKKFVLWSFMGRQWRAKLNWPNNEGTRGSLAALRHAVGILKKCEGDWESARANLADLVTIPDGSHFEEMERLEAERLEAERVKEREESAARAARIRQADPQARWLMNQFDLSYRDALRMVIGE